MNSDKLNKIKLYSILPQENQNWLKDVADSYPLSFQHLKILTEYSADLICWNKGTPEQFHQPEKLEKFSGKKKAALFFQQIKKGYESLIKFPKKYVLSPTSPNDEIQFPSKHIIKTELKGNIIGTCPVASEKTRCCNLKTLDVVQQCGFSCSYCSIQSFYHQNQVRFIENLQKHLDDIDLDPNQNYHIGTGQSSDSLMWGNNHNLLEYLYAFTENHPNVILEMKSKSGRIDYFLNNTPPSNMVFTWSLNPQIVVFNEEKGAASLSKRLNSARQLADKGYPVGFHFHPMIWYEGWEEDYKNLVKKLTEMFKPEEVVMVSIGTLTFIKSVIKQIRHHLLKSTILQMPMEEIGGKMSYPFSIKKQLFSTLYDGFPASWKEQVFFYMCMEDIRLWQPIFGRNYKDNEEFENDMLDHYIKKIKSIHANQPTLI